MTSANESEFGRLFGDAEALESRLVPSWLRPHPGENRLPVTLAVTAAAVLQATIGHKYGLRPIWLVPALELVLLVVLMVINPIRADPGDQNRPAGQLRAGYRDYGRQLCVGVPARPRHPDRSGQP